MQVYLIDIPIDKIKVTYNDPNPKLNRGIFQEFVISEYNRGITYRSVKYNFYAKNMAFLCTGYNLHDILDNGMQYPVSLYIDNYNDILCHPGISRIRVLRFLNYKTVKGIICLNDHNTLSQKNIIFEKLDMSISNNFKINSLNKYEYAPPNGLGTPSEYYGTTEFNSHKLSLFNFFIKLTDIFVYSDYDINIDSFYVPKETKTNLVFDEDYDFTTKRLVNIHRLSLNKYETAISNKGLHIVVKKPVKYNLLELLIFLIYKYRSLKTKDESIIITNNVIFQRDETYILPMHYASIKYTGASTSNNLERNYYGKGTT